MPWEVVGIQLQEWLHSLSRPHPRRKQAVERLCTAEALLAGVLGISNRVTGRFGRQTHKSTYRIRCLKAGAKWGRRQEVKLGFGDICLASCISLHAEGSHWYLKLSHFLLFSVMFYLACMTMNFVMEPSYFFSYVSPFFPVSPDSLTLVGSSPLPSSICFHVICILFFLLFILHYFSFQLMVPFLISLQPLSTNLKLVSTNKKRMWHLCFWVWLILLSSVISSSIHFPAISTILLFYGWIKAYCACLLHFLYPFFCGWTLSTVSFLSYCEWHSNKHRRAEISLACGLRVLWVYQWVGSSHNAYSSSNF